MNICQCCGESFPVDANFCSACEIRINTEYGIVSIPRESVRTIGHHKGRICVETSTGFYTGEEVTN